jgi:hypothetical protein
VLLAVCFGLAHIAAICGDVTSVVGSALVNPPPLELPENIAQWRREMRRRVVRSAVRRPATVPRRVAYRFRYGPGPQWQTDHIDAFRPDGHLRALVEHGPLWVLANEDEPMTSELRDIIQNNDWASGIELTTTRIGVRPPRSLEARDLIERGLVNWAAQCLSRATSEPSERA